MNMRCTCEVRCIWTGTRRRMTLRAGKGCRVIDNDLCRFYSPNWLSTLLATALPECSPTKLIDLGCGPGALSSAVATRWPNVLITTVDLDPGLIPAEDLLGETRVHKCIDILAARVSNDLDVGQNEGDLVISNPPYTRIATSASVVSLLQHGGLDAAIKGWTMVPADLVFLAQAIDLSRDGGVIAFIVPDTMISSDIMKEARRILLANHSLEKVIQLPRRTFLRTDAQAFILVLRKGGITRSVELCAVDAMGTEQASVHIDAAMGVERLDCVFHLASSGTDDRPSLAELGVTVARGKSNSRRVASSAVPIFHTCDFPISPGKSISIGGLDGGDVQCEGVVAEKGDILLARVDRRLERKVALVGDGKCEISDCVLRLRAPSDVRDRVLAGLISNEGARQISAVSRGTGARHISHKSVLGIRV
jgi:type I restriction enzyme M protein